jgi:glycosyltransferase involved in cell wall biosynthesis
MAIFSIIIPVFNEKSTILEILKSIEETNLERLGFQKEIIIVDDGSTDGTKEILKNLEKKYKIIYHSKNQGKGRAIKTGLNEVSGDFVIIQDADLEYHPKDYEGLLRLILEKKISVVYGSRWLNSKNFHPHKLFYWGGLFLTFLTNFLYGQRLTDVLTGYKLFKTKLLKEINLEYSGFEFCCEVTAKISKKGIKIFEVPISYFPRQKELKKIKIFDGFKMLFVLLKYRFLK